MQSVNEKRRRGVLNWLDWIILACLVAAIASGVLIWRSLRQGGAEEDGTVRYLIVLSDCEWDTLEVGSVVRSQNGTAALGRVTEVRVEPHRMLVVRDDALVEAEISDRYDLFLVVESGARRGAADGIRVSDIRIAAGVRAQLRIGERLVSEAEIVEVEWRETHE